MTRHSCDDASVGGMFFTEERCPIDADISAIRKDTAWLTWLSIISVVLGVLTLLALALVWLEI